MSKRWRRWDESEARGVLEELARSGEGEASFCRRRGIGRQRLRYWRQRIGTKNPGPAFLPVDLHDAVAQGTRAEIAIRVGDVAVCVREDLDVEHVARLVEALERRGRMLTLPPGVRVFVATERIDGRKGIDGLAAVVRSQLAEDPLTGSMYVFTRRADRVRVLYWDRDGYVLVTKRLEKGTYRVPWASEPPSPPGRITNSRARTSESAAAARQHAAPPASALAPKRCSTPPVRCSLAPAASSLARV